MSSDPETLTSTTAQVTANPAMSAPTHHMNTDSRANKRTRASSPSLDSQPTTRENNANTLPNEVVATTNPDAPPSSNKRPNLERQTQPPPPANAWNYLRSNTAAEVAVNGVRTLDSGYKITATPVGGFPVPQLGQSTWRNVSPILKEKWPQKEGAKAWVRTYRTKHESNAQGTVAKLKDAITKIVGDSDAETLVVSTPTAEVELIERLPPPWHYLISGIPPEAIQRLLHLQVCSSADITCFFVPFEQPLPTYAFTLENFSFPDSDSTNHEIATIVKNTIRSNPDVMQYIHDNIPTPDAEAALRTVASVRVSSLSLALSKSVKETVWNVYFECPPALTLKQYFVWTNLMRSLFYISEDYGYGTARQDAQFVCMGCKSFDHPTGLCPFPKIHGWFGPSASDKDNYNVTLDNRTMTSHGRGAFNGNMSRGGRGLPRGITRGNGKRGRGRAH